MLYQETLTRLFALCLRCLSRSCICWLRWQLRARQVDLQRQSTREKRKLTLLTSTIAFRMWSGISFYAIFKSGTDRYNPDIFTLYLYVCDPQSCLKLLLKSFLYWDRVLFSSFFLLVGWWGWRCIELVWSLWVLIHVEIRSLII